LMRGNERLGRYATAAAQKPAVSGSLKS
jgi:hypothetical protein